MPPVVERPLPTEARANSPERPRSPRGWSRTGVNFLLDLALLVVFLLLASVSVVVRFVFPAGTAAAGWTLWGRGFDDWSAIQFGLLCLLAFGVLLHLMMHWSWVCGVVASRLSRWRGRSIRFDDGAQTLYGVGLLIVAVNVVGLLIAAAALMIRAPQ